jgi:hypothetical protein
MNTKYIGELVYWAKFADHQPVALGVILGLATEIPHDIGHPGTPSKPNYTVYWFIRPPAWVAYAAENANYLESHLLKHYVTES